MNIHSIASLIAFLVCTSLSAFVFFRGRRSNVHNGFIIVTQLTGIWSLFPFLILNNLIPVKQILLVRAVYLAAIFISAWVLDSGEGTPKVSHGIKKS